MIVFEIVGRTRIAARTGLGRESLYNALSAEGNRGFATVLKVLQALDMGFQPVASPEKARASEEARGLRSKPQGVLGGKI